MNEEVEEANGRAGVRLGPASTYEAITRMMVERLSEDVREIRNRINGLFWLIAGTVVVDIAMRMAGLGR